MKLLSLLIFAMLFMDPCAKTPRKIELKDVGEACTSEINRMYVRISGTLRNKGNVVCSDQPGGIYCKLYLSGKTGSEEIAVKIHGVVRSDTSPRFLSVVAAPQGTVRDGFKPYSVPFDAMEIYDRDGNLVDHRNGTVDVSGSLQIDEGTKQCSLRVSRVENEQSK